MFIEWLGIEVTEGMVFEWLFLSLGGGLLAGLAWDVWRRLGPPDAD